MSQDPTASPQAPAAGTPDDRFRGLMYGAALGAAVALPCDGRDASVVRDNHDHDPSDLDYPRDAKRGRFRGYPLNDWTGDVDQAFLVMKAFREKGGGQAFENELAAQILRWASHGLNELGDSKPVGVDSVTFRVVGHPDFLQEPAKAATETVGGGQLGSTPMLRCLPLAALPLAGIFDNLPRAVRVTHSDRRVAAASLFEVLLVAPLIAGHAPDPEHARYPLQMALKILVDPTQRHELRQTFDHTTTLKETGLEYPDGSGHATKTVRAAMWAFRQLLRTPPAKRGPELFKRCITEIALCGRNSSEHAAVVGAVLGAALGLSGLPPEWVAGLPGADWVEGEIAAYLATLAPAQ